MLIYFDCEFTDLNNELGEIYLISAGFVAENGLELYFELTDNYKRLDCSNFVLENVLPHLDSKKHGCTRTQAVERLTEWLENFGETVYLATDAPKYDWQLIKNLLVDHKEWPNNLKGEPVAINADLTSLAYDQYFEFQPLAIPHHALWDARALCYASSHT
jgi:hypothetical protein